MNYQIQLFAQARELAGTSAASLDLQTAVSVADLKAALLLKYPRLATLLARSTIAVNDEYATDQQVVPAHASLALIPPVSGG
jgi:molybdopterin converting factor subunit 1